MPDTTLSADASTAAARAQAVAQVIARVRAMTNGMQDISIATAQSICVLMTQLASDADLWKAQNFPVPQGKLWHAYLLHEDTDGRHAMYAVAMKPGHRQPPHNHTTWAVIAGVRGHERNVLYARESNDLQAHIRHLSDITVGTGGVLALGANDIHSIEVLGPTEALHLHLYGRGFTHLQDRLMFDLNTGIGSPFPIIQTGHRIT